MFFSLGLKSGLLKVMNIIYMFGCYLKTWVNLTFCFYYGTRKKCVNMNPFLKWKLSEGWLLDGINWKKISFNFCFLCRSGESLSGFHRIEAQEETNFKMNSLISEVAPQTWFYKKSVLKICNSRCMKNNIFVKTLNINIIFSWFSVIDGYIIFFVKRKLKKISYFL